jgi:hypothetical protein
MQTRARRVAALALVAVLSAPSIGLAAPSFCRNGSGHPVHGRRWCIEKGYGLGDRYVRYDDRRDWSRRDSERARERRYRASAWNVVRNDRCLWNEYRRYASKHENPNKRQRFVERLSREGCDEDCYRRCHPHRYSSYYQPGYYEPYYDRGTTGVPVVDWLFGR